MKRDSIGLTAADVFEKRDRPEPRIIRSQGEILVAWHLDYHSVPTLPAAGELKRYIMAEDPPYKQIAAMAAHLWKLYFDSTACR